MRVYVGKNDIKNGQPGVARNCPIALALKRRGFIDPHVGISDICLFTPVQSFIEFPMNEKTSSFRRRFDHRKTVEPFRFEFPFTP